MNIQIVERKIWIGEAAIKSLNDLHNGVVGGLELVECCTDEYLLGLYLADLSEVSGKIADIASLASERLAVLRETRTKENGHGKA